MATAKAGCTTLTSTVLSLNLLQKRKLDSISDGPAPPEPKAKHHHTTNRCRLTELPDELLTLIAEHLVGYDDPTTYVCKQDGKLVICYPKTYQEVSLPGLRQLSDTLFVESQKALHRNGIINFEDQFAYAEYFNPRLLDSDPRLANIRLATQRVRFLHWELQSELMNYGENNSLTFYEGLQVPVNVKKVHLGGGWWKKLTYRALPETAVKEDLIVSPSLSRGDRECFGCQAMQFAHAAYPFLSEREDGLQSITFGPGPFGHNTIHDDAAVADDWESHTDGEDLISARPDKPRPLVAPGSIVPMPSDLLAQHRKHMICSFKLERSLRQWKDAEDQLDAARAGGCGLAIEGAQKEWDSACSSYGSASARIWMAQRELGHYC